MKILLTRPFKQSQELAKEISALHHQPIISPLLEISYHHIQLDEIDQFEAILITSKNALAAMTELNKQLKLLILGKQTLQYARTLGFMNIVYMGQNIAELKTQLNREQKLLYLSGEDITDELSEFPNITRKIIYTAKLIDKIDQNCIKFFQDEQHKIVMLFSSRTAEIFSYLVNKYNLNFYCDKIIILALSDKILLPLQNICFKAYYVATTSEVSEMINLIDRVVDEHR